MELKDTIEMMISDDYRTRFRAEYAQLLIRADKLGRFIHSIEEARANGEPEPAHDCPMHILYRQCHIMMDYLSVLNWRATLENISLEGLDSDVQAEEECKDEPLRNQQPCPDAAKKE